MLICRLKDVFCRPVPKMRRKVVWKEQHGGPFWSELGLGRMPFITFLWKISRGWVSCYCGVCVCVCLLCLLIVCIQCSCRVHFLHLKFELIFVCSWHHWVYVWCLATLILVSPLMKMSNIGVISHLRLTILPDGGVMRVRAYGLKEQQVSRL